MRPYLIWIKVATVGRRYATPMENEWLPRIDRDLCTGCGDCIAQCPVDALGQVAQKAALVRPDLCTYCTLCEDICPVEAIELPFLICFADGRDPDQGRRAKEPDNGNPNLHLH